VRAVVLESFVGSNYADTPDSYEFPPQYLAHFDPLTRGEPMVAVIYEPRGDSGLGRTAYVGWTLLQAPPEPSGRTNARGQTLYRVRYADRYRDFDRPVPREAPGEPVETWLRSIPRGRDRNVATFGRAVRPLLESDLEVLFSLGFPAGVGRAVLAPEGEHAIAEVATPDERARRLVNAVQREARFRDDVLDAYSNKCAVSGLTAGPFTGQAYGLLDAAHIRPVSDRGIDSVSNGLALSPTLHRYFDRGLFTLAYRASEVVVRTSPRLTDGMVVGRDGFSIRLVDGQSILLPAHASSRPSREQLEYHQAQVFISR
jgi:putative restriction endonuclease